MQMAALKNRKTENWDPELLLPII